jgi:lipopolysaccharide/colanic/teichoic acid biosynthesis glycosyltransferase
VQDVLARATVRDVSGITLIRPTRFRIKRLKAAAKRALDVSVASLLLLLTAPVFLVVAAAIKLESKGPLFFKQTRARSRSGPRFLFCKFRSMHSNAGALRDRLRTEQGIGGGLFKIRRDPRVTAVGRIIRRFSIDELPQLLNVLAGDMSLVGPRPLPADDLAGMSDHDTIGGLCRRRATVKPGITGLWQICGRSELGTFDMMLLDLYYIQNHTILFDLEILLRTIPAVLIGRGAY